jgi:mannose-6-phosphate isomerase
VALKSQTSAANNPKVHTTEDWVASTTSCYGYQTLGQKGHPSGILLRDEIKAYPLQWLGQDHINAFGTDTKLLVDDVSERLLIHAYPHAKWDQAQIRAAHGKSEAWYVLTFLRL